MSRSPHEIEADEYAKTLEDAGLLDPESPAPKELKEEPEEPEPETNPETPPDGGGSASGDDETPAETEENAEPFPGFNALSDEAKELVAARLSEAEQAKAKADDFEKRWKAQHGQLAPTQRELEQARRTAQAMAAKLKEYEAATPAPSKAAIEKYKEQFPDEGAALEELLRPYETQAQKLVRENAELRQMVQGVQGTIARQNELTQLSQRHPDWQEVDSSDVFKEWLNSAGERKQALAKSGHAADVADVIDDYKRDLALAYALAGEPAPAAPAAKSKPQDIDPKPTVRQSLGKASNAGSSEADEYAAVLQAAGYQI